MCIKNLFKTTSNPSQLTDYIPGHDPSQEYLDGQMPTYTPGNLIKHLEERMEIHQDALDGLIAGTGNLYYGDANFHRWALEGYSNSIYYLRGIV